VRFPLEESCGLSSQHDEEEEEGFLVFICMHRVQTTPTFLASRVV